MRDISKWFETRSTDRDSAGIRRHLDDLIAKLTGTASGYRHEESHATDEMAAVPDSDRPDEPVNSL